MERVIFFKLSSYDYIRSKNDKLHNNTTSYIVRNVLLVTISQYGNNTKLPLITSCIRKIIINNNTISVQHKLEFMI